ncbi:LamG-like jellyroll fold domain-containing protein [Flaviaesturariibacter amylovorans]|uniref:Ig-like domain-containing protein n=1 Tax=Flaviaesturariibacter amylovorans TaxID=1084520 RepID=UPI0031E4F4F4
MSVLCGFSASAQTGSNLIFDGNDYLSAGARTAFDFTTGTVELWVKPAASGNNRALVSNRTAANGTQTRWSLHLNQGGGTVGIYNGSAFTTLSVGAITANTWYRFTFVLTTSSVTVYRNGTLAGTINSGLNAASTGNPLLIGASDPNNAYPGEYWLGSIDEVRIWNVARTATEISNSACPIVGSATGLIAYYRLDQGTAGGANSAITTATDASASGFHATLVNFALTGTASNWVSGAAVVAPPEAAASQTFCPAATLANVSVTGTSVKWYAASSGGSALAASTALVNGTTYWASQTVSCESSRTPVTVSVGAPAAPTAATQDFCGSATVANLSATGTSIAWYAASSGGSALASTTSLSSSTYYASQTNAAGCESGRTAVTVNVYSLPSNPNVPTAQSFCANTNPTVASLTGVSGAKWYAAASGGSPLATTTALTSGTSYYASQTNANGCEGTLRTQVTVTINAVPPAPTAVSPQQFCGNPQYISSLSATGSIIQWFPSTSSTTPFSPSNTLNHGSTYYAAQTVNGCRSTGRAAVTVSIRVTAVPTGNSSHSFCQGATIASIPVTGTDLRFYNVSAGGSALATSTVLASGTYYVTQTVDGCESARKSLSITINANPAAPAASPNQVFCGSNHMVANLVASGYNIRWYTTATGGSALAGNTALSNGTYYASQTPGSCESSTRTAVNVVIQSWPAAPYAPANQTFCHPSTVADLQATGDNLQWFYAAADVSALSPTTTLSSRQYYVSQTVNGCAGPRTPVTVVVNNPAGPSASNQTFCGSATVGDLVATATGTVSWYSSYSGGSPLSATTPLLTGSNWYFAAQTVNGCTSSNRTGVWVHLYNPAAPTASPTQSFVNPATVADLQATGSNIRWYAAASGGTALASSDALTNGSTYYATQTTNSCESARTPVTVSLSAPPSAGSATTLDFNGVDNYINCGARPEFDFMAGTVECWVKPAPSGDNKTLVANRTDVSQTRWSLHLNQSAGTVGLWNGIDFHTLSVGALDPSTWYRVTFVMDGASTDVFLDGVFKGTLGIGLNTASSGNAVLIGAADQINAYPSEYWAGQVDEVRIWNRKLTDTEINNTRCGLSGTEAGLVANYRFDQGIPGGNNTSVTSLADAGPAGFNGTLMNFLLTGTSSNWLGGSSQLTAPVADTTITNCVNTSVQLTPSGANLQWYTSPSGGTPSLTAPVVDSSVAGTTTYYVSQSFNGCESPRARFDVVFTGGPAPTTAAQTFCGNGTVGDLAASGSSIKWYGAASGGTALPATDVLSSGTYYATQTVSGCESARTPTTVTVGPALSAPAATSQNLCEGYSFSHLSPEPSATTRWYATASGGSAIPGSQTVVPGTYYIATHDPASGCESARTPVDITLGYLPPITFGLNETQSVNGPTVFSNNCGGIIAAVAPSGSSPVSANVSVSVWLQATQPDQFVRRHYEITPAVNPNTATGTITLYYTQEDFDSFNAGTSRKLPIGPSDAAGIARLLIEKRSGTSSDGTGLPATYSGTIITIDPDDNNIVWNASAARWEVTFPVSGFSGFFAKTVGTPLPVTWLQVTASLNRNKQAQIDWKVTESNVRNYVVQRSHSGRDFADIQTVNGLGDGTHQYRFTDPQPVRTQTFYRIRQQDRDGTTSYSATLRLRSLDGGLSELYPNPTTGKVLLRVSNDLVGTAAVLTDLSGKQVKVVAIDRNDTWLDLDSLTPGVFVLQLANGEMRKLVKL